MKTAIICCSRHHGNTRKLVDAIAQRHEVTCIDATAPLPDLSGYDLIGFASGIYYSKFHKSVLAAAEKLPQGKRVFFLYTFGAKREGYTRAIREAAEARGAQVAGEYGCPGYNTFGPFKLIGGMAKGHPTQEEIEGAVRFFDTFVK